MKSAILLEADDILARPNWNPRRGMRSRADSGYRSDLKLRLGRPLAGAAHSHSLELSKKSELRRAESIPNCLRFQNLSHEHLNLRCEAETDDSMPEQLPLFEIHLRKRGRGCRWCLCTTEGHAVMQGSAGSRTAAKYQSHRALFLMLLASAYRPPPLSHPDGIRSRRIRSSAG
ncbi:hypothetical protein [Bradyrhizobium sp. sBnM-33]|uniref:hypothetical protein n=1 Tax=Bradyrhizobium sp. sBnM-33 TaxID=2831780 RepID=UPI001BCE22AB|nr:hypothetical protein [Bradyrhizobium sp. sBnM-33]WOH54860.1 hypothetical protein RX328_15420 [Bradyrhizobium sp. sBnM-33]